MKSKLSRRIFALLLTLAMILTLVPTAFADTGFADVKDDDWYAAAVKWAVEKDPPVTNGTDATHFSPDKKCTRAEVVQFIWNAYGKPASTGDISKFKDVAADDWFAAAVKWAIEKNVTSGTDATHFSPTKVCTRAEVAQFLYAAAGKPEAKPADTNFPDVKDDDWFAAAVKWAVGEGITSGTGDGTFAPSKKCTRAEIVQFLYKAFQNATPVSTDFVLSKELKDGDEVVIYNAGHGLSIKNETDNDWYLMGAETTIDEENHKVVDPTDDMIWKVSMDANGMTRFTNGDNAITCWVSGNFFELTNNASHEGAVTDWGIVEADAATYSYYIKNWSLTGQYGNVWLEFYTKNEATKLSAYCTSPDRLGLENFGFQFYVKGAEYVAPETPPPSEGDYVLTTELKTGDELVLFNAGNGKAVTAAMSGYYIKGTDVTPEDHKIANPAADIVWTATVNDDGSVTLRNGSSVLAAGQSPKDGGGYYNNLYLEEGENAIKWTREVCNADNMSFTMYANGLESSYGHIYLEWYGNKTAFSAYDTSADRATEANFGFQFYVKGAEYIGPEPPQPGQNKVFVKVTAEPEDWEGTYIFVHENSETEGVLFDGQSEADNNYLEASINGDQITASTEHAITIEKSGEGYTFKTAAGKYMAGKIYQGAGSNGMYLQDAAAVGTIAWVGDAPVVTSDAGTVLRYNNKTYTDATYHWFRFFTTTSSVTTDANTFVNLYKLDESIEPGVNTSELRAEINYAKELNPDDYDPEVFAAVAQALKDAEAVLNDPNATQEEVDAALAALKEAIEALPALGDEYTLTTELKTGDLVVIYCPAATKAVDSTLKGSYYLSTQAVTLQGDKIINPAETVVWTVTANDNGTYTFDQFDAGLTLVAYNNGDKANLGNTTGDGRDPEWVLTAMDATAKTFSVKSNTILKNGDPVYLEYYSNYDEISAWGNRTEPTDAKFAFQFYSREGGEIVPTIKTAALEKAIADAKALDPEKYTEESYAAVTEALRTAEAVLAKEDKTQKEVDDAAKALNDAIAALVRIPGEGEEYVLTNALKDGDKVIIYHPTSGMAVSNADLSASQPNYRAGVAVTPEDDKIIDPDEAIVWTVSEAGACFVFEDAEGHQLSCSGSNLKLDADYPAWRIQEGGIEGTVNIVNDGAPAGTSGDPRAMEWYAQYSEFSCYYLTATNDAFALQLFVKTESEPPVEQDLLGKIVILHTNDTHGAIMGYANVAGLKAEYEARGAEVILVDAGDFSQGTPYVSSTKGMAAIEVMNAAGYDFVTLGNHEFDFGYTQLKTNLESANFEVLCADIMLKEGGASAFRTRAIKEINGFKIGFFGMETPETFTKVNPGLITEITFPQGEEMYKCAQDEVQWLKDEGADIIIGIVHLGVDGESEPNRSIDLYNHVEGIDFLIDGHSHTVMTEGPNGEPIQSTGTKATSTVFMNVGCIIIDPTAERKDGRIQNELIALAQQVPTAADPSKLEWVALEGNPIDKDTAAVAQGIMDVIDAEYKVKFATSEVELNGDKAPGNRTEETNMGDLITDAMLWSVLKDMDAETLGVPEENVVAITNGGGIREWIHAGDVTKSDVNTVLPFGNTVAVVYVTGAELLEALEASTYCTPDKIGGFPQVSGMKYTIDTAKDFDQGELYPDSTYHAPASIQRVRILEINGQPFDPEAKYAVVTNNFCAVGGDTYYVFVNASAQFDTGIPMDEALINYITEKLGGVIGSEYAEPQGRIIILEDLSGKTVILHTNDTHGALLGFAQVASVKNFYEEQGAEVILVDAGDYSQGTPYVSSTKGAAAIAAMNAAGYDFATLGNHEFDFGYAQLKTNLENAEFRVLCADVFMKESGEPAFYAYAVEDVNGVKIGFFGMETPETFTKVNPALITEITFPQGEAMYEVARGAVNALRNNEGVDLVIGIVHLGVDGESEPNRSIDLYNNVEGIDFLIDGHSHTVMTEGPNGEPIQSTGTKASKTALMNVGVIVIDNETKAIEKNELYALGEGAPVDETVAAAIREITDPIDAEYSQVFATSEVELNGNKAPGNRTEETNMGDLITDALKWSVMKDMDAETLGVPEANVVAITNGGGIREWIHAGDVTKSDVNTVLPFGNTVAVVYVTGAELLEALEASTYCTPDKIGGFPQVSGIKFNINTAMAFDQGEQYPDSTYYGPASIRRVTIDNINGEPFDPAAKYAVVTNNFCAEGGDTYYVFKNASAQFDTGIPMDEALIDFITNELNGVIDETYAEPQGRITQIEYRTTVETTFPSATKADIDKYGDVHFSISSADLAAAGFEYADLVKLSFLDQELIVPIIPQYRYVGAKAVGLVMWEDGTKPAEVEVFNGSFAATYGLADVVRDGSEYTVTPRDGVEFPVPVTITMYEKQGYADTYAIFDLNRSNDREDYRGTVDPYPDLTDEEFANFRKVTTTGMGDGKLYRASSPINPSIGRNTYADAAAEAAGVKSFVNLADSESSAAKYAGYTESYYASQKICFLNLGVDFTTELNREGLKTAMEFIASEDSEAPFLVHCNEGQDRAGFVSALLECLMGATYDEVVADYMVTFYNYYGVQPGTDQYKQISNNIIKNLSTAFGIQMSELATADLAAEAEEYLKELGVSDATIAAVKAKLSASEPEYVYYHGMGVADGDEIVIVHHATNMALSKEDMSETYPQYRAGVAVTPVDGIIEDPAEELIWTVVAAEGGYYLEDAEGNKLSIDTSAGRNLKFGGDADVWEIKEAATEGCVYIASTTAKGSSGDALGIEWYAKYSEFTVYYLSATMTEADFALDLYIKTDKSTIHEHDWVAGTVEPADCTHQEITHYTCSICSAEKTEVTADALGHTPGDPVEENKTPASCTAAGGYDTVTYCTVCSAEISRVHTTEAKLDHVDADSNGKCDNCGADMNAATSSYEVASSVAAGDKIVVVFTVGEKYYALANDTSINNALVPVEVTYTDGELDPVDDSALWTLEAGSADGTFLLKNGDKYIKYGGSGTSISMADAGSDWVLTLGEGASKVNASGVSRYLYIRDNNGVQIRCYSEGNMSSSGYYAVATIYKFVG